MRRVVLAGMLVALRTAHADDFPDYPQEYTDRPILFPRGMAVLDIGLALPTTDVKVMDGMGATITRRTSLGQRIVPSVGVERSFGIAEIGFGIGSTFHGGVNVQLGDLPADVFVGMDYLPPIGSTRYAYIESLGAAYKLLLAPKRFALFGSFGVTASELATDATTDLPASSGVQTSALVRLLAELQLSHRVTALFAQSVYHTLTNSSPTVLPPTAFGNDGGLLVALGRWDVSASFAIFDVTGRRLVSLSFGATDHF